MLELMLLSYIKTNTINIFHATACHSSALVDETAWTTEPGIVTVTPLALGDQSAAVAKLV